MPKPSLAWALPSFGLMPFPMTLSCPSLKDSLHRVRAFVRGQKWREEALFKEKLLHFETFL